VVIREPAISFVFRRHNYLPGRDSVVAASSVATSGILGIATLVHA
jgi:hypothetical protein